MEAAYWEQSKHSQEEAGIQFAWKLSQIPLLSLVLANVQETIGLVMVIASPKHSTAKDKLCAKIYAKDFQMILSSLLLIAKTPSNKLKDTAWWKEIFAQVGFI